MTYNPAGNLQDAELNRELAEVAKEMEALRRMPVRTAPPYKPRDGEFCVCDGAFWNPLGDGVKRPIWYDADTLAWRAF